MNCISAETLSSKKRIYDVHPRVAAEEFPFDRSTLRSEVPQPSQGQAMFAALLVLALLRRLRAARLTGLRMLLVSLVLLASGTAAQAHDLGEDEGAELCIANGGPFGVPGLQDPPSVIGAWEQLADWGYKGVHATVLGTGKVLRHQDATAELPGQGGATLWHPSSPNVIEDLPGNAFPHPDSTVMSNPPDPGDLFCSGHTPLTDGRVFTTGGGGGASSSAAKRAYIFHGDTASGGNAAFPWIRVTDMAYERWYPTATSLPDGRVLVHGGVRPAVPGEPTTCCVGVGTPEIYQPVNDTWITLPAPSANERVNYPRMYVLPDGLVLKAFGQEVATLDVMTETWDIVMNTPVEFRDDQGSGIMYRPGKLLVIGGDQDDPNDWSTNERDHAQVLDTTLPKDQWAWRAVANMTFKRRRADSVLLPDGKVLIVGGLAQSNQFPECAAFAPEVWDPATEIFTQLASHVHPRLYHSTTLLLPDARVIALGGEDEHSPPDQFTPEIFSPPYLFQGPRPTIQSAPRVADYGQIIDVETPDRASIGLVTFLRSGSVTHNNDMSQRYMELSFVQNIGGLDVTMPDANLAPPGDYMLFLVNTSGVPSIATFVRMRVDRDGDGIFDDGDASLAEGDLTCDEFTTIDCDDNCPLDVNPLQIDTDLDMAGNACDDDDDNDGFTDEVEIAAGSDPLDPLSIPTSTPMPTPTPEPGLLLQLAAGLLGLMALDKRRRGASR